MRHLHFWLVAGGLLVVTTGCVTEEQKRITPAKSGERQTVYGQALDRAERSACEQYLQQLNQAVQIYRMENEANPPDLATVIKTSGLPQSELQDCKYTYDPTTGRVGLVR